MDVSNHADQCIHCGCQLHKVEQVVCKDCGKSFHKQLQACPYCGCPKEMDVEPVAKKKKGKKKLINSIIAIVVLLVIAFAVQKVHSVSNYERAVGEVLEEINKSTKDLNESYSLMIDVWKNGIWKDHDKETDPYVYPNGVEVKDFDEALGNLYDDKKFIKKIDRLNEVQQNLRSLKFDLEDAPNKYSEMNEILVRMIDLYVDACMQVINPIGSYNDITEEHEVNTTEFNDLMEELDAYLEQYNE